MAQDKKNSTDRKVSTIKDVAQFANVSISTVSRVINSPEVVKDEKRSAVEQAIKELHYVPNPVARALGGKRVGLVAVVVPNIINSCIVEQVNGAMQELARVGYDTLLFTSNEDMDKERKYVELLREKIVDGAIFIIGCGKLLDFSQLTELMPIVLIDRFEVEKKVDTINADCKMGFRKIIQYLKCNGHSNIGLLCAPKDALTTQSRVCDFNEVMAEEGLAVKESRMVFSRLWKPEAGYDSFIKLMTKNPDLTAVISASDVLVTGVLAAAREMNFKLPEDISIVGFENTIEGKFSAPPLSTLNYPNQRMGQAAAKILAQRMSGDLSPAKNKIIPLGFLERGTSGKAKEALNCNSRTAFFPDKT